MVPVPQVSQLGATPPKVGGELPRVEAVFSSGCCHQEGGWRPQISVGSFLCSVHTGCSTETNRPPPTPHPPNPRPPWAWAIPGRPAQLLAIFHPQICKGADADQSLQWHLRTGTASWLPSPERSLEVCREPFSALCSSQNVSRTSAPVSPGLLP